MDKKKMIAVPLIAIMLSLTTAVAVAHWVDNLSVEGYVQSGTLCACFTPLRCFARGEGTAIDWTTTPGPGFADRAAPTNPPKNIAKTTVTVIDCDTVVVNVTNGYPCYTDHVVVGFRNCGTVPWAILKVIVYSDYQTVTLYNDQYFTLDLTGNGKADIEFDWGDNWGVQKDPGRYADVSFDFHLLNPIPQNATLTFYITFEVVNWNEYSEMLPK